MNDWARNEIRAEVMRVLRGLAQPRMGRVTSYDPNRHAAKVKYLPEGDDPSQGDIAESGWIPVATAWIGNGWGLYFPPSIGDQVAVNFQENDPGSGVIAGRVFDQGHPPLAVPSGECWLVHQTGASFKLTNDGKVALNSGAEIDIGNLTQAVQTVCLLAFYTWVVGHTHGGVQPGSGNTAAPNGSPPGNSLTSILKAN